MLFFNIFLQNTLKSNNDVPDQTPHYAVSALDLHCLHIPPKKDARFIWVMSFLRKSHL